MALEPITRAEQIMSGEGLTPITREEMFLAKAAGQDVETPTPITRREMFLSQISGGSGGGSGGSSEMEDQFIRAIGYDSENPVTKLPDGLTQIRAYAFYEGNVAIKSIPAGVTSIGQLAFYWCDGLTEITFKGTPSYIDLEAFNVCDNLLTINVPWAEGEVANAPWSATNATINYNYMGG